jgi:hypothetical protein
MRSIRGGVEKPCTMPARTRAFMGSIPKKLRPIAINVNTAITT